MDAVVSQVEMNHPAQAESSTTGEMEGRAAVDLYKLAMLSECGMDEHVLLDKISAR